MLVSKEVEQLAAEVFKADPKIIHQGLIDLEGNVLLDQSSAASTPMEPDPDRIKFYNQLNLRRHTREHFDDAYGKTDYIHITREKMQQMILYLPMITIYLTLEKSITPEEVKVTAQKIKFIDNEFITNAIKS
ncbi:MAG: hypothetical protein OEM77_07535 [Nitrosopumilus sp.]|nr:hypothetical protein [Nitrosopumilus sp.]MDH3737115.1 hypothetical protein [Nitrosopumilus sp.]MDH3824086.1 hypothetical protein [Nitrosopumilus sp.]